MLKYLCKEVSWKSAKRYESPAQSPAGKTGCRKTLTESIILEDNMKVAVTYEKETGNIFQHFGKTQYFKIYQIEDGKILSSEVIDNGGNGHHAIPPYLKSLGVETLILGNRGQGAIEAIAASGLKEMPGITGSADKAAELFAKGELKPNFEAKCNHHGEHHNN